MWRVFVLMMAGLFGPLSAVAACDSPAPAAAENKPAFLAEPVKKFITFEMKGKPVAYRCLGFGRTSIAVTVGDETFWLDLGGNKDWHKLISELGERRAVITGELVDNFHLENASGKMDRLLIVRDVRAEGGFDEYVKRTFRIELRGQLEDDRRDILWPYNVVNFVKIEGKSYYLNLAGNKTLSGKLGYLKYQTVVVTGTLEEQGALTIVHVETIESVMPLVGCFVP